MPNLKPEFSQCGRKTDSVLLCRCSDLRQLRQPCGDVAIAVGSRVLIPHRHSGSRVTQSGHQLCKGRTSRGRKHRTRVPQIMKPEVISARDVPGGVPGAVERARGKVRAARRREQQAVFARQRVVFEVAGDNWQQSGGIATSREPADDLGVPTT